MAFNLKQMRTAMATTFGLGSSVPYGWNYDAEENRYIGPNGDIVTEMDILNHGTIQAVLVARNINPFGGHAGGGTININNPSGQLSVASMPNVLQQPASTLSFETDHGRVTLDIKTGDLTIPVGMGQEDAIREFWLGFLKYFNCGADSKLMQKIKELQQEVDVQKSRVEMAYKVSSVEAAKHVAEKIAKKYNGEKFIMVKPEDLIRFIESE